MLDRLLSLLVALSLALLVWLYARSRDRDTLDNVAVPVQVALSPAQAEVYSIEAAGPPHVLVSFSGPPNRIRDLQGILQRNELQVILPVTLPTERLQDARHSETIHVQSADIQAPAGVTAMVVEGRNRVTFTLHRLVERRLAVRFCSASEEPVGPVVIDPPTVLVRGPQEVLDRVRSIPTQPSEAPARPGPSVPHAATVVRVSLVTELEGRPVKVVPARVTVRAPGQPLKVYELADLPINFLCPADFPLRPRFLDQRAGRVSLRVQGPVHEEAPKVSVCIDLTRHRFAPGGNREPLWIQLPKDFQLAQDSPGAVAFDLLPTGAPARGPAAPLPSP
jgi:hypothetical protein